MTILGVDPGRDKIGWALVDYEGELLSSGICPVSEQELFSAVFTRSSDRWAYDLSPWTMEKTEKSVSQPEKLSLVAVGNGTGSPKAVNLFERLGVQIIVVDESGTTLEAQGLYWGLHAPSWWQRCLPRVMRFPPRPLDDMAAWVIARRSLQIFHI